MIAIIEIPHQRRARLHVFDSVDRLIDCAAAHAEESRADWPSIGTREEALDYLGHDLSNLLVVEAVRIRRNVIQELVDAFNDWSN